MLPIDRVQLRGLYETTNDTNQSRQARYRKNAFQKKFYGASDKQSILTVEKYISSKTQIAREMQHLTGFEKF